MDEGDVGLGELAVDVVELEDLVVGDVGLCEQDVHMPGHASGDGVDGVAHLHSLGLERVGHLAKRMLRLRHCHAVTGTMMTEPAFFMMNAASSALPC